MLNRRPRRQMNQMNVVPYIDVMLVLLVIFMVTTPLFTPGVIDVPSVSNARAPDSRPLELLLAADGGVQLVDENDRQTFASMAAALPRVAELAGSGRPVAVSASGESKYQDVVKVADELYRAGVKRVALTVRQENAAR
ncbi:cell division and transport-associated protein TolR [Crenobacter luteus]|uniref:Protein TolR n=1 Tax=Crenobacter luteus TaxID=1452487 RepID=A0A163DBI7_9NEIS|nr:biopolymer transporter ExbD [Crenobacter luteus]KZE34327.1 protein TolR [Crenobacter luteus]TCP15203.1 cell division and transport-associated protein TolR [Crenobacter luteus]